MCVVEPRRADAAPVPGRDGSVRMSGESLLRGRYRNHGGLTPAAPRACAFVHRKSRNCVDRRTGTTKSGGRKPPVVPATLMHHKTLYRTVALVHAKQEGGVSPPWLHDRDCNGVRQHAGRQSPQQWR